MSILSNITHWFQKSSSALDAVTVAREQQARYNALLGADPDKLTAAVTEFNCGHLAPLARLIEDYERRDDKMKTCSMKMKASVARCDYSILEREGFQGTDRAKLHADILKRFWSGIHATSRFNMNERGGLSLLKKQMMDAQSYGFAVHELVWTPLPNGELTCEFIQIPLWHFENRTGRLQFLRDWTAYHGSPMRDGEWLVTTGDGIGVAAALCACVKRLTLADWAVFCERCGMPIIHAKTGAAYGSDQWKNLNRALRAIGRDARIQTDSSTDITALSTGGGASQPYTPLVEWADRAIAALYRGADLSTISNADATGASLQGDETSMLEGDACERLSETLHEQVDRFVIRYVTGDAEPLAGISIEPTQKPNIDQEIKIDQHLVDLGVKLSKNDALQRYGRTEADPADADDAALEKANPIGRDGVPSPSASLFNEKTPADLLQRPLQAVAKREEASGRTTTPENAPTRQRGVFEPISNPPQNDPSGILAAFAKDTGAAAEAVKRLLENPTPEAAAALLKDLPNLIPEDPEMAAVIAEAMAAEFGPVPSDSSDGEHLENEAQRVPGGNGNGGQFTGKTNQPDGQGAPESPKAKAKREKRERQEANKAKGVSGMESVANGEDVKNFMQSQKLGRIAFYQGNENEGYLHIKNNPDPNHQIMLKDGNIPNTLAYGKYYKDTYQKFSGYSVVNGDKCVFLGDDGDGVKIITAYASNTKAAVFKGRVALENEEVQAS